MALTLSQPLTEMSIINFAGGGGGRKDNFTAICEPAV
jgi:hypothetical protein